MKKNILIKGWATNIIVILVKNQRPIREPFLESTINFSIQKSNRAIFAWPWKMVSVNVRCLFYQPVDERIKTWPLRFPAKENPNIEKALFDWPVVLQYDVKAKCRLISRDSCRKFFGHEVFSAERSLNQPKATRVCIRSITQSNRSISVRLLFLFCSRVFISRSYENRSNRIKGYVHPVPDELSTGWKIWPVSSSARNRSVVFALLTRTLNG